MSAPAEEPLPDDVLVVGAGTAGRAAQALLDRAGCRTRLVGAGGMTEALSERPWDLALLGWSGDGLDGPAVCAAIRAHPSGLDLPLIALVCVASGDRPASALEAGADDYVVVPCEPIVLAARVRTVAQAHRAAGAGARLRALVANIPGAVYRCEVDEQWTMHYISAQIADIAGYPPADLIGSAVRSFASIIHPDDRGDVARAIDEAIARRQPFAIGYRIVHADGGVRWVVERGRLVRDPRGRPWLEGVVLDVTAQRLAEEQLRVKLAEQAAGEERSRLARELHDSVSQALFSMMLHARAAQLALQREGSPTDGPVGSSIAELRALTQSALAEMRALIFELRPGALQDEGLATAVRKHAAAVAAREGLDIVVDAPARIALDAVVEEHAYRVVQESLHNVAKHARATSVRVVLDPGSTAGPFLLEVRDDGVGFDPDDDHPGHLGLVTMRERVERIGGRFTLRSAPGRGTEVHAEIPAGHAPPE